MAPLPAPAPPLLLALDSASLYFRAFHGVPASVVDSSGRPVNAVRGFVEMVTRLVTATSPGRVVAAWDSDWRPDFRVALLPSYKAHRAHADGSEVVPDGLPEQVAVIEAALAALGVPRIGVAGFEADDVLATLAARGPGPVAVVSGDRDLVQVVDDAAGVRLLYVGQGLARMQVLDEAAVLARYKVPARAYADLAVLRGDPSDGLPGVPGIGEVTAAGLLARYGSLAGALAALDAGEPVPAGARLAAARDYLARASVVVAVRTDVALPAFDDTAPAAPADPDAFAALAATTGLGGPLGRLAAALAAGRAAQVTEE